MYNATLNNDYDSYPTQEEYKKFMEKNGQKYYQYAGGPPRPETSYIKFPKGRTNPMQVIPLESYQTNQEMNQNVGNKGLSQQQQRYIDLAGNGTNNMMGFVPSSQQGNYNNNINNNVNRVPTPQQNYNNYNNNINRVPTPQQNYNYNFNNNINRVPTPQQNYNYNNQNRISSPQFQTQQKNYFNQNLKSSPIYQNNYQQTQISSNNNRYNINNQNYSQRQIQNAEPIY